MGLETATYVADLVSTNPLAADNKSQGDDHLRLIKAALQATFPGADLPFYISADRADVASAASCDIGAAATQFVNITGTTTITSFATANAGVWRLIRFNASLTLTHNGTSLILPGGGDIQTAAGDTAFAFSRGSGNWTVLFYQRASAASRVVGEVADYAGTSEPSGWLFCYGQAISRTTYAALFALLGTTWGTGNGTTTFNIPDLRGRVVAGKDNMGGSAASRLTGVTGSVDGTTLGAVGGLETQTTSVEDDTTSPREGTGNAETVADNNHQHTVPAVQPTMILNKMIYTGVHS